MALRFQELLNFPIPYFLVQRPDETDLVELSLILLGEHPTQNNIEKSDFQKLPFSSLTYQIAFLSQLEAEESKTKVQRSDVSAHLSSELHRIFSESLHDLYKLELLMSQFLTSDQTARDKIRVQVRKIRNHLTKQLLEGRNIAGEIGTAPELQFEKYGLLSDTLSVVEVPGNLSFPTHAIQSRVLTLYLFLHLSDFLRIPESHFYPLAIGNGVNRIWLGSEVELELKIPWQDRSRVRGTIVGYTYEKTTAYNLERRLLERDPKVWREMWAYVLKSRAGNQAIFKESNIDVRLSEVTKIGCDRFLSTVLDI